MKKKGEFMNALCFGIILFVFIWGVNEASRSIMSKVHQYNRKELAKLNIPFYPIISYVKFRISKKMDDEK